MSHQSRATRRHRLMAVEGLETRAMLDAGGHFDLGFGPANVLPQPGLVTTLGNPNDEVGIDGTKAVAVAANGDIYEAGILGVPGASAGTTVEQVTVIGLLSNGNSNSSFGEVSASTTGQSASSVAGLVVEADGMVDVLAKTTSTADSNQGQLEVYRFNPSGLEVGSAVISFGGALDSFAGGIAVQADGKIVVDGTANLEVGVTRLNSDLSVDTTFGTNGQVIATYGTPSAPNLGISSIVSSLAIQADGKILVGGTASLAEFNGGDAVARLNPDGSFDTSFGTAGIVIVPNDNQGVAALALAPNGDIVLAGGGDGNPQSGTSAFKLTLELVELTPSGILDTSFNQSGLPALSGSMAGDISAAAFSSNYDGASAVTVQADGKIVVATANADVPGAPPVVLRYTAVGNLDPTFGVAGAAALPAASSGQYIAISSLAIQPDGKILVGEFGSAFTVARLLDGETLGDYSGVGKADPAVYLPAFGAWAIRPSSGGADLFIPFGIPGLGQSIPTPGDYDGSGKTEISVYLPSLAAFAYRPANGGPDVIEPIGLGGPGNSIPAQGDYFATGQTDFAVYLPSIGAFAIRPPNGSPDEIIPFGIAGDGQSIPVPGDYDNSGRTELAVYIPSQGILAYRPANGGPDVTIAFGIPGMGQTIPAPGDYDGSGKTEVAAYIPSQGIFAYRPANGGPDVIIPFGSPGPGQTIPAPGDYDGDGKTDIAAYLPTYGSFAYRPSSGGPDFYQPFGLAGVGQTLAASSLPEMPMTPPPISAESVAVIPMTIDELGPVATNPKKR